MNILLINDNPVVSRLLALCTREKDIILDEVRGVNTIRYEKYDVVFIDEGSYEAEVLHLSDILTIGKKILLSNEDVEINDFDMTIKKPFLPSQIIEIIEAAQATSDTTETEAIQDSNTQVLDKDELEKIKTLLDMDDELEMLEENLSEEEIEVKKIEAIKEQLMAEGLEIVGEEEIVEELSNVDEVVIFSSKDKSKKKKSSKNKDKKAKNKKKKSIAFNKEELDRIEDAVQVAIATLKRKQMKKLLKGKEIELSIKLEDNK